MPLYIGKHGEVTLLVGTPFSIYSYNVIRHNVTNLLFTYFGNNNFDYILFSFDSTLLSTPRQILALSYFIPAFDNFLHIQVTFTSYHTLTSIKTILQH